MFNRANSNVKLASSSRVEYTSTGVLESSMSTGALEYEYERSSARVRGVRSSSEARVRVLEFYPLKLTSKSARTRRSRLSSA